MVKKRDLKKEYLIFISYSSKDKFIGRQVSRLLEEKGVKTFLDEKDIDGGESVTGEIRDNIKKCDEFIVLLTPNSINSQWVNIELGAAWGLEKMIISFQYIISDDKIQDIIKDKKWFDLNDFEKYLPEMMKRAEKKRE